MGQTHLRLLFDAHVQNFLVSNEDHVQTHPTVVLSIRLRKPVLESQVRGRRESWGL